VQLETFTREEKRSAPQRDRALHHLVYPKWVAQKRMAQFMADDQIAVMEDDPRRLFWGPSEKFVRVAALYVAR
jgi:hypothetical protein